MTKEMTGAQREMVMKFKPLAWKVAGKTYTPKEYALTIEDKYQIAMKGLCVAATKWDESKGTFATWAQYNCQWAIWNFCRDHGSIVKVSRILYTEAQRTKDWELLPRVTFDGNGNASEDKYIDTADANPSYRLEVQASNDPLDYPEPPTDSWDAWHYERETFKELVSRLDPRSQTIIELICKGWTQKAIAPLFDVSQMEISRMKRNIVNRLKRQVQATNET